MVFHLFLLRIFITLINIKNIYRKKRAKEILQPIKLFHSKSGTAATDLI